MPCVITMCCSFSADIGFHFFWDTSSSVAESYGKCRWSFQEMAILFSRKLVSLYSLTRNIRDQALLHSTQNLVLSLFFLFYFVHTHLGFLRHFCGITHLLLWRVPINFFALKATISDINMITSTSFWLMFAWYFSILLFSTYLYYYIWSEFLVQRYNWIFFYPFFQTLSLTCNFRPFIFSVLICYGLSLPFYFLLFSSSLSILFFLLSYRLIEHVLEFHFNFSMHGFFSDYSRYRIHNLCKLTDANILPRLPTRTLLIFLGAGRELLGANL